MDQINFFTSLLNNHSFNQENVFENLIQDQFNISNQFSQNKNTKIKICGVCKDRGKSKHFGSISFICDSCKAFFRRSVQNETYKTFFCSYTENCEITILSRKCCQSCRFEKCLRNGMEKSWVMSEEERLKLLKNRQIKKKNQEANQQNKIYYDEVSMDSSTSNNSNLNNFSNFCSTNVINDFLSNDEISFLEKTINEYIKCFLKIQSSLNLSYKHDTNEENNLKENEILNEKFLIRLFISCVYQLTNFFKNIDPIKSLKKNDQQVLLCNSIIELCFLLAAFTFDAKKNTFYRTVIKKNNENQNEMNENIKKNLKNGSLENIKLEKDSESNKEEKLNEKLYFTENQNLLISEHNLIKKDHNMLIDDEKLLNDDEKLLNDDENLLNEDENLLNDDENLLNNNQSSVKNNLRDAKCSLDKKMLKEKITSSIFASKEQTLLIDKSTFEDQISNEKKFLKENLEENKLKSNLVFFENLKNKKIENDIDTFVYSKIPVLKLSQIVIQNNFFHKFVSFIKEVYKCNFDETILFLISMIVLFNPDRNKLKDLNYITKQQEKYLEILKQYSKWKFGSKISTISYSKILVSLASLREISEFLSEYQIGDKIFQNFQIETNDEFEKKFINFLNQNFDKTFFTKIDELPQIFKFNNLS